MTMTAGASLPIDVRIPGVGRIKKRSGVHSRAERDDLVAMLRLLPKQGHGALVVDIQAGRRSLLEVYRHYVEQTLAQLDGPRDDRPLWPLVNEWLDRAECGDGTRDNRRDAFRALRPDGRRTYLLRDLPELLQAYRVRCETAKHPRIFNIAKTCVQAFVRDTISGKRKPLTLAVADIASLKERKRGRAGLTVAAAIAVRDQLGSQAGRIWWSMCLTGMGPKELWGMWSVEQDRVHIEGTKAFGRVRDVPLVDTPVRPEITRDGFTSALRRLSETLVDGQRIVDQAAKVTPYQARKTFARWMEDARIPRARREIYRGHGNRDVGDLYERYEVTTYLRDDAQAMRALLPQQGLRLEG